MRCLGFTKSFRRCKRNCRVIYCSSHKLQWWGIILIIGTIAGLYQDVLAPIFADSKSQNTEIAELAEFKKEETDSSYLKLRVTLNEILADSSSSDTLKNYLKNKATEFDSLKKEIDTTSKRLIKALKKGNYVTAYEIRGDLHKNSRNFQLDSLIFQNSLQKNTHLQEKAYSQLKVFWDRLSSEKIILEPWLKKRSKDDIKKRQDNETQSGDDKFIRNKPNGINLDTANREQHHY